MERIEIIIEDKDEILHLIKEFKDIQDIGINLDNFIDFCYTVGIAYGYSESVLQKRLIKE